MSDNILHGEIMTPQYDSRAFYEGVRTRRVMAFLIDYVIVFLLCIPAAVLIAFLGLLTFGLGWSLYAIMFPLVALFYVARTLGGEQQATKGMQMMNIKLVRLDGVRIDPLVAVAHTVLFWGLNVILTPLILLAMLVLDRKRGVHDLLLGTVVIRSDR